MSVRSSVTGAATVLAVVVAAAFGAFQYGQSKGEKDANARFEVLKQSMEDKLSDSEMENDEQSGAIQRLREQVVNLEADKSELEDALNASSSDQASKLATCEAEIRALTAQNDRLSQAVSSSQGSSAVSDECVSPSASPNECVVSGKPFSLAENATVIHCDTNSIMANVDTLRGQISMSINGGARTRVRIGQRLLIGQTGCAVSLLSTNGTNEANLIVNC